MATELATLAGGCFWCVEPIFDDLNGVLAVENGYTGGHVAAPTYRQLCNGDTGHAEAARVEFDPSVIGYDAILDFYFHILFRKLLHRTASECGNPDRSVKITP